MAEHSASGGKPLPRVTELTQPFWNGAREGKLVLQCCGSCGEFVWCPQPACTTCGGTDLEWRQVSGHGTVYSFTVIREIVGRGSRGFADDIPYVVAWIDLDEGPRLCSNVIGCGVDEVAIGMKVEAVFEEITPEISLPKFRPQNPEPT